VRAAYQSPTRRTGRLVIGGSLPILACIPAKGDGIENLIHLLFIGNFQNKRVLFGDFQNNTLALGSLVVKLRRTFRASPRCGGESDRRQKWTIAD